MLALSGGGSEGALIAPFAFLGPRWDPELEAAFTTGHGRLLRHPTGWRVASQLLFPLGQSHRNALFDMVDHYVTPALVAAVARATERGRRLIVATTDLDGEETVLWDRGAIAEHDGRRAYAEMHVDGSVTTPVFALPPRGCGRSSCRSCAAARST